MNVKELSTFRGRILMMSLMRYFQRLTMCACACVCGLLVGPLSPPRQNVWTKLVNK